MPVSSPSARITMLVMLIAEQKSHTSSHPHSPEVLRSASQRRRKRPHQYMAGLQPSETRSTRQRSRRPPATTSAAPFRSNTLPLSRRHSAAKHPQRSRQHQKLALSSAYPSNLQAQLQTATSPPLVRDHLAPPDKALLPKLDLQANLKGQSLTTLLLALPLQRPHAHRQAARLAARGCLREATPTRSRQQLQWPPPMLKVASLSPRARLTPSRRRTLNRSLRPWASQVLASRALSGCSQSKSRQLADIPRAATNDRILLPRRLAV